MQYPLGLNQGMLGDIDRFHMFNSSLAQTVSGKVVLDIGSGSGLLAVAAIKNGAQFVYAVEQNLSCVAFMRQVFKQYGFEDRIQIIHSDFLEQSLPVFGKKVEVIVSETITCLWIEENIYKIAKHARSLFPEALFIPGKATVRGQLIEDDDFFKNRLIVNNPIFDEIKTAPLYRKLFHYYRNDYEIPHDVWSSFTPIGTPFDILKWNAQFDFPNEALIDPLLSKKITNAWLVTWWESEFVPGLYFTTGPNKPVSQNSFQNSVWSMPELNPNDKLHFAQITQTHNQVVCKIIPAQQKEEVHYSPTTLDIF